VRDSPQELLHGGRWSDRRGHRCGVHEAAAHGVGDADEVRTVGREPEDAPAWTEVDRIGLSTVRCPAAVEHDDAWSGRWSGAGFGWSRVLSRGEPDLVARGGAMLGGQCSAQGAATLARRTVSSAPHNVTRMERGCQRGGVGRSCGCAIDGGDGSSRAATSASLAPMLRSCSCSVWSKQQEASHSHFSSRKRPGWKG
jgi:hypothetical protein